MIFIILFSVNVMGENEDITNKIIAYYSFDDINITGDEIDDISGNGTNATNFGASSGATGKLNEGLDFNSAESDYVLPHPDIRVGSNNNRAVNFWVKPDSISNSPTIFFYGTNNNNRDKWNVKFTSSGQIQLDTSGAGNSRLSDTGYIQTGQWQMITLQLNGTDLSNVEIFYNGTEVTYSDSNSGTINTVISGYNQRIGYNKHSGGSYYDGILDEMSVYNDDLTSSQIETLYNSGDGLNLYEITSPTINAINFSWVTQTPNDLNFGNIWSGVNITYNISNYNDTKDINLSYTVEDNMCPIIINESCVVFPQNISYTTKSDDTYMWYLDEYNLVPGNYILEENLFRETENNILQLDAHVDRLKIKFNNISNETNYNVLEINLISEVDQNLPFWYCNSTYIDGLITLSTLPDGCTYMGQIETTGSYNHTHSEYSGHQTIPMNITDGMIGDVVVTPTSYFITKGVTGNALNVSYLNYNSGSVEYSSNLGINYIGLGYTIDAHIHQFYGDENLSYQACAYNLSNDWVCSDEENDAYDELPTFAELPFVRFINPEQNDEFTISDTIVFRWFGDDFDGDELEYSLFDGTSYLFTSNPNTSYSVDMSAYSGSETFTIEACEVNNPLRCSDDSVDISVSTDTSGDVNTSVVLNFDWDVDEAFPNIYSCPTNYMQYILVMTFFGLSIFILVGAYMMKNPIFIVLSGAIWITTSLFMLGCHYLLGLALAISGLGIIILGFNVRWFK